MRPSEPVADLVTLCPLTGASCIESAIFGAINVVPGIVSVSLVGSFCERADLSSISDIDTVVIVETLTSSVFAQLRSAVLALRGDVLGLPGFSVRLNDTFGPCKFDAPKTVVIHLMVYDIAGHREHVLKSPFTCYDWERTEIAGRRPLAAVYPVVRLQPGDLFQARRGLGNYIEDLGAGSLSFRHYSEATDGSLCQVEARQPLDSRHAGEYAFHIMKFMVGNYVKLLIGENRRLEGEEFEAFWTKHLPECTEFLPFYRELAARKATRTEASPDDTIRRVQDFLAVYGDELRRHWVGEARRLVFYRHAPTSCNGGSFLGQGRNPCILSDCEVAPVSEKVETVFTSPLRRAVETAALLCPGLPLVQDSRLTEINYGQAEGMTFAALRDTHPQITDAWARGEDPRFPGGENTADVMQRLKAFMDDWALTGGRSDVIVTHNVVIRVLLGTLLGWPMRDWHRVTVPYCTPVEVHWFRGRYYLNLAAPLRSQVIDALLGWPDCCHVVA